MTKEEKQLAEQIQRAIIFGSLKKEDLSEKETTLITIYLDEMHQEFENKKGTKI